jgi:hypothetical protein
MNNKKTGWWWSAAWMTAALFASVSAHGGPMTGAFKGQGRGCWGKLYIKEKTLQWTTPYSICKPTPYKTLEQDFTGPQQHIAFELAQRSAQCRYAVVALSFDPQTPDYWLAKGYASRDDFTQRQSPSDESKLRTLSCAVQKQD